MNEAKKDESWAALDAVENLEIPEDFAKAFSKHKLAAKMFDSFPRSVKRSILEWIGNAKTAPTRAKRVVETASLAARNVQGKPMENVACRSGIFLPVFLKAVADESPVWA